MNQQRPAARRRVVLVCERNRLDDDLHAEYPSPSSWQSETTRADARELTLGDTQASMEPCFVNSPAGVQ